MGLRSFFASCWSKKDTAQSPDNYGDYFSSSADPQSQSTFDSSSKEKERKAAAGVVNDNNHPQKNTSNTDVERGASSPLKAKDHRGDDADILTDDGTVAESEYSLYVDSAGTPIYIVKQKRAYFSIMFSSAQTIILAAMMIQCTVAPFSINPMIGPYPDALSYWGGKNAYNIVFDHEWWRLGSPIMLHAGIIHLICNISVQLDVSAFFEKEWGSATWLIIYLGSAVGGSILSTIVSPNTIGVGSSGSVCGLFGAKIAEFCCRCCESKNTMYKKLSHNILVEQFASTMTSVILVLAFSFVPYVDWAAHVGGLLGGFCLGMIIFSLKIKTLRWRFITFLFGLTISAMFYSISFVFMYEDPNEAVAEEMGDVCGYYMKIFDNYNCKCMLARHQNQD